MDADNTRSLPQNHQGNAPDASPRLRDNTAEATGFAQALALGDMQMAADDLQGAFESFERALTLLGDHPVWRRERVEARLRIAECHTRRGEYQEALAELARIRGGLDARIETGLDHKVQGRIGQVQQTMGDYLLAEVNCRKAYEALRGGNDNEEIGLLEIALGNIACRLGQIEKSKEFFESALFTFRRIDHREGIARALNNLGVLLKSGPRWKESLDYLDRALAVSEEAGNAPRIASHSLNLGVLLTKCCEWTRALQVLSRALLTFRDIDNDAGTTKTHIALGNLKQRLGQSKIAASHYTQALALARKHGYRREEALALEFLGEMALREGRGADARRMLGEALQRAEAIAPEGDLVCEVKRRLGEEAKSRARFADAIRWITEAEWIASHIDNSCELGASLRLLGELALETGRPEAALAYLRSSAETLRDTPDLLEETITRIRLAQTLVELSRGPSADSESFAQEALAALEPVGERILRLDLLALLPEEVEAHARAMVAHGDLDGALRVLDRGIAAAQEHGVAEAPPRLQPLRAELAENQAEALLATSEEFQILQEFSPLHVAAAGRNGGIQKLLDQMAARLQVDRALLAVGESVHRMHVEGAVGVDRPATMLRALEPILQSFETGRRVWLTGSSAADPRLGMMVERWKQEGPLVALRLRPSGDLWGVLAAERRPDGKPFGHRDLRLISLFGSFLSVAIEARQLALAHVPERTNGKRETDPFADFLTTDRATRETLGLLRRVAASDTNVLITGETGTGKGLLAQKIHTASRRKDKPFVQVNCAALPEQLLESELFGHVAGAFTGAVRNKRGLIEEAEGGTLFLDEVDRSHRNVQAKLLHILDRREFRPVGGVKPRTADVRIICATNTDLATAIQRGLFLEDLFYRLNDFQFSIPPLRDRREDIPLLVQHFLSRCTAEAGRHPAGITREALRLLVDHEWRGNVRELEKCVRRFVVLCEDGEWIGPDLLPKEIRDEESGRSGATTLREAVHELEARLIGRTLEDSHGNKSETSRRLRISYPALLEKIRRYRLEGVGTRKIPSSRP